MKTLLAPSAADFHYRTYHALRDMVGPDCAHRLASLRGWDCADRLAYFHAAPAGGFNITYGFRAGKSELLANVATLAEVRAFVGRVNAAL